MSKREPTFQDAFPDIPYVTDGPTSSGHPRYCRGCGATWSSPFTFSNHLQLSPRCRAELERLGELSCIDRVRSRLHVKLLTPVRKGSTTQFYEWRQRQLDNLWFFTGTLFAERTERKTFSELGKREKYMFSIQVLRADGTVDVLGNAIMGRDAAKLIRRMERSCLKNDQLFASQGTTSARPAAS